MLENAREVYGSVRVGGKNPKSVWYNDKIKAAVRRKENTWVEILAASDEETKKDVWKPTERRRERLECA